VASVAFDIAALLTRDNTFAAIAFWNLVGGLVGGLIAAIPGTIDWVNLPAGTRAKRVGSIHGLGNLAVLVLFSVACWLRIGEPGLFNTPAFVIGMVAFGLLGVTGWLGGELVDRLGVGVDAGAHLNAPNSLAGRPAREAGQEQWREREVGR
jgi:uncharacterized membrane protein